MRILLFLAGVACFAQEEPATQARRILESNCGSCHGAARMGGLDLRQRDSMLKGGTRGAAVVPGKADESLLYQAVLRNGQLQMPPGKKGLAAGEIQILKNWIDAGARWAGGPAAAEPSWWSFRKLKKPQPPPGANAIDAFIAAKLTEKGLRPAPQADKRTLIRRLTYDLHGLPPSRREVEEFLADNSAGAYAKLVDRLLASPRYGERWGRHWLDVVRYADTGGFETDIYFPNAWRYRDYVIKSLNQDKPYNQFVQEQIAGDEIWPDDLDMNGGFKIPEEKQKHLEAKIATGMYTIGPVYHEAAFFGDQVRYEWLTDVVDTTGEAFLGLTLGCSRCHDHKFDPLTTRDYHRMMAVFAASEEREVPVVSKFSIFGFKSGYPNWLKVDELKAAVNRIERDARKRVVDGVRSRFPAPVLAAYDVPADKRTPGQRALAAQFEKALTEAGLQENAEGKVADIPYTEAEQKERERLTYEIGKATLKANPVLQTATVLGPADRIPDVHITSRGDWRSKGEIVSPGLPQSLAGENEIRDSRRRKALALWLTDPQHPLTARVMVNRVWHWHFGRGIVATPNDFGRQGEEPTHPELLDWLAADFVEQGWSLKKLHKQILMSETYRRSTKWDEANGAIDANNRYLWRMNRQRVDAETLRDATLAVSGQINFAMGGRPVIPTLTKEEYTGMWARNQWPEALDPAQHNRRSVYLYVKRAFPLPMFTTFDAPDTSTSCARRDSTTVAPQALTLMNSEFMQRQAARFAERLRGEQGDNPIARAWALALGRPPTEAETTQAHRYLAEGEGALERLCLVLLNMNEFLYVD
ncbi:MAG: PSD1 and planctomycete cytochrome C domain-containing protein [Bryobacteraceae bacterium]|nr:PSD1 and planctomycete cytochrome C domain-containing protein [Bryobacteraceae bacterium]